MRRGRRPHIGIGMSANLGMSVLGVPPFAWETV
jgi:hypothetical protein